jgi:S1-C subfamily serine protease
MTVKDAVGISFAIPVDTVKEFLETAVQKKSSKPVRGYIGVHMLTLTPGIIDELLGRVPGFPSVKSGVFIPEVVFNSPSHRYSVVYIFPIHSQVLIHHLHVILIFILIILFRAGIYPGDIIVSINGTDVTNSQQVYDFVAKGELLTIGVLRGRKTLKVVVQPETVE